MHAACSAEPVEEIQAKKSWQPPWKKPKKDSPEAEPSPRNPARNPMAALRKSVPDSLAIVNPLKDAGTPLRSSTGMLLPLMTHLARSWTLIASKS